jgi:hypothetical protein
VTEPQPARPTYVLRLRPTPQCPDPIKALRWALKLLLRRCHLRCTSCEEVRE